MVTLCQTIRTRTDWGQCPVLGHWDSNRCWSTKAGEQRAGLRGQQAFEQARDLERMAREVARSLVCSF